LFDVVPFYKKNPGMYSLDLLALQELLAEEKINPVLDTTFPLEEGAKALDYLRDGKAKGKVVLVTEAYSSTFPGL
jgi:NADPH2:quinone reductase